MCGKYQNLREKYPRQSGAPKVALHSLAHFRPTGMYHYFQCNGIWMVNSKLEPLQTCITLTYENKSYLKKTHYVNKD